MLDLPYDKSTDKIYINSLDDVSHGKNKNIDLICDGILNLTEFHHFS